MLASGLGATHIIYDVVVETDADVGSYCIALVSPENATHWMLASRHGATCTIYDVIIETDADVGSCCNTLMSPD